MLLGKKARALLVSSPAVPGKTYHIGDIPSAKIVADIWSDLLNRLKEEKISQVVLLSAQSESPGYPKATLTRLLPVADSKELVHKETSPPRREVAENGDTSRQELLAKQSLSVLPEEYEFEPDSQTIIDMLFHVYVKEKLLNLLSESKKAEHLLRSRAMMEAGNNTDKMIAELENSLRNYRQQQITREILEIASDTRS